MTFNSDGNVFDYDAEAADGLLFDEEEENENPSIRARLVDAQTTPTATLSEGTFERIDWVLDNHGDLDLACLCWLCPTCGSIGATHDRNNRDLLVANIDFTCCDDNTVTFTSVTHTPLTFAEAQTVRDLLRFYLNDGTHPVNVDDAAALQARLG